MDLTLQRKELWPWVGVIKAYFPLLRDTITPFSAGTATLISPWAILTAAHVVYNLDYGGEATSFNVDLGNGAFVHGIPKGNAKVLPSYKANPAELSEFDYSVVLLGTSITTIEPATVVRKSEVRDLAGAMVNVVGYPAVPAGNPELLYGAHDFARVDPGLDNGFSIQYPIATLGGMSGGPLYRRDEAARGLLIRGIHNDLLTNGDGNGLVLNESRVADISRWVQGN
jgi:V8-like Glu-specific endopeptidase